MNLDQHSIFFSKTIDYVNRIQKIAFELYEAAEHGNLKIEDIRIGLLPETYFIREIEDFEVSETTIRPIRASSSTFYGFNYFSLNEDILNLSITEPEFNLLLHEANNILNPKNQDLDIRRLVVLFTSAILYKVSKQIANLKLISANPKKESEKLQFHNLMREYEETVEFYYRKDTIQETFIRREKIASSISTSTSEQIQGKTYEDKKTKLQEKYQEEVLYLIDSLTRHINASSHFYEGNAFLYGINVNEEISLITNDINIKIRPLLKEDFEYTYNLEEYIDFRLQNPFEERLPSAKIVIRCEDIEEDQIFLNFERVITCLRLFRLGSIDFSRFHVMSTSLLRKTCSEQSDNDLERVRIVYKRKRSVFNKSAESYLVTLKDATFLKSFIKQLFTEIPDNFLNSELPQNYLSIAYSYYIESVINDSTFESRLATAVMGIESLFLSEKGELRSRLSNRVAKILGLFKGKEIEFRPIEVKKMIERAYDIRSVYVHGVGMLSHKESKRIIKEYGGLEVFLTHIQEIFRISINVFMALKDNHLSKEDFLTLIDDSFIDDSENEKITGLMKTIQHLFDVQ